MNIYYRAAAYTLRLLLCACAPAAPKVMPEGPAQWAESTEWRNTHNASSELIEQNWWQNFS